MDDGDIGEGSGNDIKGDNPNVENVQTIVLENDDNSGKNIVNEENVNGNFLDELFYTRYGNDIVNDEVWKKKVNEKAWKNKVNDEIVDEIPSLVSLFCANYIIKELNLHDKVNDAEENSDVNDNRH